MTADYTYDSLLVLSWLTYDLRKQVLPPWEKLGWFGLTLWLGVPGLLFYLAGFTSTTLDDLVEDTISVIPR